MDNDCDTCRALYKEFSLPILRTQTRTHTDTQLQSERKRERKSEQFFFVGECKIQRDRYRELWGELLSFLIKRHKM